MLYLSQLPIWLIPLSLCLYVTGLCLNAVRWKVLLVPAKIKISFKDVTKMVFSGVYASNFLPTTVGGDAVRFISMLRFSPDRVLCFTSIAIDRVVNMAAFLTILPITLAVFGSPISLIKNLLTSSSKLIFLVPLVGKVDTNEDGEPVSLLSKLSKKILSGFTRGKISFTIWLKNPGYVVLAFAISWLSIFVIFVAIWLVATGLEMQVTLIEVDGGYINYLPDHIVAHLFEWTGNSRNSDNRSLHPFGSIQRTSCNPGCNHPVSFNGCHAARIPLDI